MPRCSIQSMKEGEQIKQIYIQTKEQLLYGYILSSQENHSEFLNPTEQSYRPNLMLFVVQSYNYIITPFFYHLVYALNQVQYLPLQRLISADHTLHTCHLQTIKSVVWQEVLQLGYIIIQTTTGQATTC